MSLFIKLNFLSINIAYEGEFLGFEYEDDIFVAINNGINFQKWKNFRGGKDSGAFALQVRASGWLLRLNTIRGYISQPPWP